MTAELLSVSPRTVERTRTVLVHADEPTRQAVLSGVARIKTVDGFG